MKAFLRLFAVTMMLCGGLIIGAEFAAQHGQGGMALVGAADREPWVMMDSVVAADGRVVDYFGDAVALDVNTALIGAPSADIGHNIEQGAAYVYVRDGSRWRLLQKLIAADGEQYDFFGATVAVEEDTALIYGRGAVYVFERSGDQWRQQQKLDSVEGGRFGISMAIDGNTAIFGAPDLTIGDNIDQGAAYVFTRSGSEWLLQQKLVAGDDNEYAKFGSSVAVDGGTAIVGARGADIDGDDNRGAAYVYTRSAVTWNLQAKLVARRFGVSNGLGGSVALDGSTAVAGAVGNGEASGTTAHIFTRSGGEWREQQELVASEYGDIDLFGSSLDVYKDTIIVGAPGLQEIYYESGPGMVYVFTRRGDKWHELQKIRVAANGEEGDKFGESVALYRNTLLIGGPYTDVGFEGAQGRAYFYERRYEPRAFLPVLIPGLNS